MPTAAWLVLAALGFGSLRAMPNIPYAMLKAILVRTAAFLFLAAGTISAGGLIGSTLQTLVHLTGQIGAGVIWVGWFMLALAWIVTILPEQIYTKPMPDWLSMSGLALPAFLGSVPGEVGTQITKGLIFTHDTVGVTVTSWFNS